MTGRTGNAPSAESLAPGAAHSPWAPTADPARAPRLRTSWGRGGRMA